MRLFKRVPSLPANASRKSPYVYSLSSRARWVNSTHHMPFGVRIRYPTSGLPSPSLLLSSSFPFSLLISHPPPFFVPSEPNVPANAQVPQPQQQQQIKRDVNASISLRVFVSNGKKPPNRRLPLTSNSDFLHLSHPLFSPAIPAFFQARRERVDSSRLLVICPRFTRPPDLPTSRPLPPGKSAFLRRTTSTARIWRRRRARSLGRLWEFVSHRSCHAIFPRHSLIVSHPPSLTPQCNNLFFLGYPFLTKKERKPKTQEDKKNGDVGRDFWQKQERKKERGKEGKRERER